MIGVGFKELARTPVPKLPTSYPPPHPRGNGSAVFAHALYIGRYVLLGKFF